MQTLSFRTRARRSRAWGYSALVVCMAMVLSGVSGSSVAQAADPLSWSAPALFDHGPHPVNGLTSVSCPSASLCVATDEDGNVLTSTNPTGGAGAWSAPISVDAGRVIDQISCPSTTLCVAVDGEGNAIVTTEPTAGASAWHVAKIDPNVTSMRKAQDFATVSCPTTSFCVVMDELSDLITTTEPTGGASKWKIEQRERLVSTFTALACANESLCVAANDVAEGCNCLLSSTNPSGGWAAWPVVAIDPGPLGFISSFSCPSASLCVGTDVEGRIISSATPGAGPWAFSSPITGGEILTGMSCASSTLCVAAGYGRVYVSTKPAGGSGEWTALDIDAENRLAAVTCAPGTTLCVAVDGKGALLATTNPTGGAGSWGNPVQVDESTVDEPDRMSAVSCSSASLCVAGDELGKVLFSTNPAGGASSWSTPVPISGGVISGLSCITGLCVAVGNGIIFASTEPTGGEAAWPVVSFGGFPWNAVSCPSQKLCVAVANGGEITTSTTPAVFGSWTATSVEHEGEITGISCLTVSFCVATDIAGDVLTSTNPTGGPSAWTISHIDTGQFLWAVSCPSTELCVVSDTGGNVLTSTTPTGGVSAWSKPVLADSHAEMEHVSCPTVSFCVATDIEGNAVVSTDPTGGPSAWTTTKVVPGGLFSEEQLEGVACPSEELCIAVDQKGRVIDGTQPSKGGGKEEGKKEEEHPGGGATGGGTTTGGGGSTSNPSAGGPGGGTTTATINPAQITALLAQQLIPSGKAAKIGALLKAGGLTMPFTALEAGTLVVSWYEVPPGAKLARKTKAKPILVASGQMTFSAAGTGKLKLRLTAAGKRLLKHAKRLKLTATGMFMPNGGAVVSVTKGFVLRR
jgi:hypothetical protein